MTDASHLGPGARGADLEEHERALELCTYCPKMCRFSCPVAEATGQESATPWALMGLANLVRKGHLPLTPEIARSFYNCTNCLLCREHCLHANDVPAALRAARTLAVTQGVIPPEGAAVLARMRSQGSMFGEGDREALAAGMPAGVIDPGSLTALFVSCRSAWRRTPAVESASALAGAGERCALADPTVRCCGAPLLDLGFAGDFAELAKRNAQALSRYESVICDSALCARTLEREYPKAGVPLKARVIDLVTALDAALPPAVLLRLPRFPQRAVYHDPCHLGRHAGIYDAPRRLAEALFVKPLGEFAWSRERASCCGGSGGFPFVNPATAARLARALVDQAREAGFDLIVTGSEECAAMLEEGLGETRAGSNASPGRDPAPAAKGAIKVRTVASLLAEAFGR
jgi:Fe-S oxidoreductase